jgi:hypothetical protein
MEVEITGTVKQSEVGMGTWTLVSDRNATYEIMQPADRALLQEGLRVKVRGKLRRDIMTMGMVGEVLEIIDFSMLAEA